MVELTTFQWIILILFALMCINYLYRVSNSYSGIHTKVEGFQGSTEDKLISWISDPVLIYDDTYAQLYDQLTLGHSRLSAETALCIKEWKKEGDDLAKWSVLDVGCGTGIASQAFAKMGVGSVVGLDSAPAMLREAKKNLDANTNLTDEQKEAIAWRQDDAYHVNACNLGEFTHVVVFYFSLYYMRDKELFFRHLHGWTKPGAKLAIEVVNKYKFDPMLESASPFVFSMQKYADKRLKKSVVKFNKMDYEGEFDIHPDDENKAEFTETLRFTDGSETRRHKHHLYMPSFPEIIADAERAHWKYIGYQDLLPIGFEYGYLLMFERDDSV